MALGIVATLTAIALAGPCLQNRRGVGLKTTEQPLLLMSVVRTDFLASLVPGRRAYRLSLADGVWLRI